MTVASQVPGLLLVMMQSILAILEESLGNQLNRKGGDTGGTGTMYCSTGGGAFVVLGALLKTALGLVDGAGLSVGRLLLVVLWELPP